MFQYILEGIDKVKHRVEVDYNTSSDSYAKLRPEGKTDLNHLLERIKEKKRHFNSIRCVVSWWSSVTNIKFVKTVKLIFFVSH